MKSTINKIVVTSCVCFATYCGAEEFSLSIDKYYSPYMGANWVIAGLRGYQIMDDLIFPDTYGQTCPKATFIRTGALFIDFSLSSLGTVIQHEYFGHGARVREFDLSDVHYRINFFSGTTSYSETEFNQLNPNAQAAVTAGGVEATSILAMELERQWLNNDYVDRRDAMLYLVSSFDQSMYAFDLSSNWFHPDNDSQQYIDQVNDWLGPNALSRNGLKTRVLWDWANPMLYISMYSIFNYLWYGDPFVNFTTWHIGKMRFMPTTRTFLAPYGPELQLRINLHTPEEKYIGVFLRTSYVGGAHSYGIDLIIDPVGSIGVIEFANYLSAWDQPHLLNNPTFQGNKYGFGEFLRGSYQMNSYSKAFAELGYKTSGYLPGTQLSEGWIWRVGVTFMMGMDSKA